MSGVLLFPLRVLVFLVGFVAFWMEIAADWIVGARGKTEYVREGACVRCGRCCRCLSLFLPPGVSSRDRLVRAVRLWHRLGMNFRFIAEEWEDTRPPRLRLPCRHGGQVAGGELSLQQDEEVARGSRGGRDWLIYRCGYYRDGAGGDSGRCSIYHFRHRLCRFFPRQGLYGRPLLHPDCGFRFTRREVWERRRQELAAGKRPFDDFLKG